VRRVLALGLLALATACGSTVQVASTSSVTPGLDVPSAVDSPATAGDPVPSTPGGPVGTVPSRGSSDVVSRPVASQLAVTPGSAADVVNLPGVTATTFTVGVLAADPNANTTLENAGFGAASLGDEPAAWRAAADEVNAHGGIAGRKLALVFYLVNLTDPPAEQGQRACTAFTQDHKVALVLSGYFNNPAHECLSQHGVPSLLGTNYGVDSQDANRSAAVVAWATPLLDRLAAVLPDAFQRLGKLKAGTSVGILAVDAPAFMRTAARLSTDLTRRGLKVVVKTIKDSASGDYGTAASDASGAVLQFRSAGVTEVLFVSHNAFEPKLFMQSANSQQYRPTYLLSTQQYPGTLPGLVPAGQLSGAVAIGWAPAVDLVSGYAESAPARECVAAMKRHGRSFSSSAQTLVGLLACDGVNLLHGAAALPGALAGRPALQRAALDPGTRFVSAVTFRTSFVGGRRDGVASYRPMTYNDSCSCFRYSGGMSEM
jgi:ABC-type branched-subunit amino acid transport system substrate-binding protein